jgi:uncharacterized membrane protein YgcG
MIGIAYGLTKYLKTPRNGFTAESTGERHAMEAMQIESLVIAQTLSHGPQPEGNQFDFGGGSGGGGGATGDF